MTTQNKLFIGCIPGSATEKEIKDYFSQFGPIREVNLRIRKSNQKCAGFGSLVCADQATYDQILAQESLEYQDRCLVAFPYIKKKKRARGTRRGEQVQSQAVGESGNNKRENLWQRKILVKNINPESTPEDFRALFSQFGVLETVFLVKPDKVGSKIHGYVIFELPEAKELAFNADCLILDGRELELSDSQPYKNRKRGGGRRRGRNDHGGWDRGFEHYGYQTRPQGQGYQGRGWDGQYDDWYGSSAGGRSNPSSNRFREQSEWSGNSYQGHGSGGQGFPQERNERFYESQGPQNQGYWQGNPNNFTRKTYPKFYDRSLEEDYYHQQDLLGKLEGSSQGGITPPFGDQQGQSDRYWSGDQNPQRGGFAAQQEPPRPHESFNQQEAHERGLEASPRRAIQIDFMDRGLSTTRTDEALKRINLVFRNHDGVNLRFNKEIKNQQEKGRTNKSKHYGKLVFRGQTNSNTQKMVTSFQTASPVFRNNQQQNQQLWPESGQIVSLGQQNRQEMLQQQQQLLQQHLLPLLHQQQVSFNHPGPIREGPNPAWRGQNADQNPAADNQ